MPLGGIIALAVLLPNLLILLLPPTQTPPALAAGLRPPTWARVAERLGQAGCFVIPFFYALPPLRGASVDALAVMALSLAFYYLGWARYAAKGHRFVLLYTPLMRVPLPLALAPLVYFLAASVFLRAWPLAIAALVLAAGHLPVSAAEAAR